MIRQLRTQTRRALKTLPLAALALTLAVSGTARAEVPTIKKITVVDIQRVLNDTKAGQKARKELETSSKAKQEKLDKKRAKLEADAGKLKSLSGEGLARAQEQLQKESIELQSMLMTLEQELGDMHNKLLEKMYKNAQEIVTKIAKERSIDLVLVKDAMTIIYTKDGLDITNEIVKLYDAKYK